MPTNTQLVDRYTLVHAASGFVLGRVGAPWWAALGVSIAWELAEPSLKRSPTWRRWFPDPTQDTLTNAVGDTLGLMGGWYAGRL